MVPCPFSQLSPKPVTPRITNRDVTFPHSPSNLNCTVPTVSPEQLVLSGPICFELFAFASLIKASYYRRKSVIRRTLPAAPVGTGHRLQDLNHLFLDCLASEPLCKSIFGFAVCTLAYGSTAESQRTSSSHGRS